MTRGAQAEQRAQGSRRGGFADGFMAMRRILMANFLRETRARFGDGRFSFLRALVTHMATISIFFFLRKAMGAHPPIPVDLLTSMIIGFFPFLLCKSVMQNAAGSFDSNRALLFYPGVRPLDFAVSAAMLEGLTLTAAFAVALAINYQFVPVPRLHDPLEALMALVAAWLLGIGLGLTLMAIQTLKPNLKFALQLVLRPLLFISGVMYAAAEIPVWVVNILWWNPLFHLTEMLREGVAASYKSPLFDPLYLTFWILGSWAAGLVLERYLRRNIRSF